MRICYDARVIIDKLTGLGNYTYNLLHDLLKLDTENEYVVLINRSLKEQHPIKHLEYKNLKKYFVQISEVTPQQQIFVPLELMKLKPDVYHYPNFDLPIFHPYKSVFTVHDLTYLKHNDLYMDSRHLKNLYTKVIMSLAVKKAKKIISVSSSTKNDLINMLAVPEEKIEVICEAIDTAYLDKTQDGEEVLLQNINLKNGEKYFLFIGERRPHKNLTRIIKAFDLFRKKSNQNFKLLIGGKPYSSYDEPEKTIQSLGLKDHVISIGYVAENVIKTLYENSECFIFASIYEGFGIPILEAMTCGTPVITSNISSMPEVAGDAALLVDPYNIEDISEAMLKIVNNATLRQKLITEGKKRSKDFSWEMAAEKTLKVYEEVNRNK